MIELLDKPIEKWTEIEAVIESIKMWVYLSQDGERTKADYFKYTGCRSSEPVLAGCFLCEYYFNKLQSQWEEKYNVLIGQKTVCDKFGCCLRYDELCAFGRGGSAFVEWYDSCNDAKHAIRHREEMAKIILSALLNRYRTLTGEDYNG